jgi:hypothetical protein
MSTHAKYAPSAYGVLRHIVSWVESWRKQFETAQNGLFCHLEINPANYGQILIIFRIINFNSRKVCSQRIWGFESYRELGGKLAETNSKLHRMVYFAIWRSSLLIVGRL